MLQSRYYVAMNDEGERTNIDAEDRRQLTQYLHDNVQGVLFLGHANPEQSDFRFQIEFDARTGTVTLTNVNPSSGVTDIYDNESVRHRFTQPLFEAIQLLAKRRLLEHLYALGDDQITRVILRHHERTTAGTIQIDVLLADSTLNLFLVRPVTQWFSHRDQAALQERLMMLLRERKGNLQSLEEADKINELLGGANPRTARKLKK